MTTESEADLRLPRAGHNLSSNPDMDPDMDSIELDPPPPVRGSPGGRPSRAEGPEYVGQSGSMRTTHASHDVAMCQERSGSPRKPHVATRRVFAG